MSVRTRFAPSPTGYLHVGGARTALYNYLYAKKTGGKFVLRIEDTDQERSTDEALKMQVEDLKWLGLWWQEGPGHKDIASEIGDVGPYRQSARKPIYQKYAQQLLQSGKAFYCFCSDADLETKKKAAMAAGLPPHYDGTCRNIGLETAQKRLAAGESACVRFNVGQPKDYVLKDLIRGDVTFPSTMVGDFVILRTGGMPVYNFCCVIDDALMGITHVLRAEEHLSNTLRQMMLYESFGFGLPKFGHLSIILGPDRQKLSKRHGATSCNEYMKAGYLPEALKNFISLLGWSSPDGKEIMTEDEMIQQFSLDRFTPSAALIEPR
jgi:nondiscriminating glutamyl-tRNA synthetase